MLTWWADDDLDANPMGGFLGTRTTGSGHGRRRDPQTPVVRFEGPVRDHWLSLGTADGEHGSRRGARRSPSDAWFVSASARWLVQHDRTGQAT